MNFDGPLISVSQVRRGEEGEDDGKAYHLPRQCARLSDWLAWLVLSGLIGWSCPGDIRLCLHLPGITTPQPARESEPTFLTFLTAEIWKSKFVF